MALSAGSIEIKLFADIARLQADMNKANKSVDTAMRNIDKSVTMAKNAFSGLAGAFGVATILKTADEYKKFDAQLQLATKNLDKYNIAYRDVVRISRESQSDIGSIGILYARLTNNLRDFGTSQKEIGMITESVALSLRVSNATVQETNSVMLQLSQSFGSGKINGQEFLAVSEGAPMIMRQLAKSLNVTYGELKNMSTQGELTAEVLAKALTDPAYLAGLQEQVRSVGTISSAITVLKNNFTLFIGEADKADGISKKISQTILLLADNLSLLANAALVAVGAQLGKFVIGINASIRASQIRQIEIVKENLLLKEKALAEAASTAALANNARATTAWAAANSVAMREQVVLNNAVAASSTLAARAMTGFKVAVAALGGPIGIAITGFLLFGDTILRWIDKARGLTPVIKEINDEYERQNKLKAQGIAIDDKQASSKSQLIAEIQALDTYKKKIDAVKKAGYSSSIFGGVTSNKAELVELNAKVLISQKRINDLKFSIAQAADIEKNGIVKVSEEYTKLSEKLVTQKELAIAYSRDMTTIMVEGKKAGLPDSEVIAKLEILKEKYDKATGATKEATKAKKDQAKTLKELQDELRAEDLLVERSANIQELLKEKMDEVNKVQIETQKNLDDKIAKLIIEIDTYGKTEAAIEATNLSRLTERKILLEARGENVDALNAEIAARMQLVELTAKKEQLDRDKKEADKETKDSLKEEASMVKELERIYDGFARNSAQAMTDFFTNTKTSFSDMINSILKDLLRLSIQKSITEPLFNSINGMFGSSGGIANVIGDFFGSVGGMTPSPSFDSYYNMNSGGGRAAGGPVNPNQSYLVGERGKAEMFVPQAAGTIVPLSKMGSNVSVVINNNSSSQASTNETVDSRGNRKIEVTIGDMVAGEIRRNGSGANQAIRNTFNARPTLVGR
jgi:tape measure domain-containing protein